MPAAAHVLVTNVHTRPPSDCIALKRMTTACECCAISYIAIHARLGDTWACVTHGNQCRYHRAHSYAVLRNQPTASKHEHAFITSRTSHETQGVAVPRIVPRVVVELERAHEYSAMLTGLKADVIKVLARECRRSRVDGLVTPAEPMLSKQAEL